MLMERYRPISIPVLNLNRLTARYIVTCREIIIIDSFSHCNYNAKQKKENSMYAINSFTKISECKICIAMKNAIINSYLIISFAAHSLPLKFST